MSLVTLGVADLDRSIDFYEHLGWRRSVRAAGGIAFFQLGGVAFSLYPIADLAADAGVPAEGSGFRAFALAHIVRTKDAVDATLDEAVAAGATLVKKAVEAEWGGYSGYFADPDGHLWEVAWNPAFPIAEDGSVHLPD